MRLVTHAWMGGFVGVAVAAIASAGMTGCTTEVHYHGPDVVYGGSTDDDNPGGGDDNTGGAGSVEDASTGTPVQDTVTPRVDTSTGGGQDAGPTPLEDTSGGGSEYLDCPDNWQPNSTGETCAPICAEGYHLNDEETGCIEDEEPVAPGGADADTGGGNTDEPVDPVGPQQCPEGWMPAPGSGDPLVCVPVQPVTLHGVVTDAATGTPIPNAWVDITPLTDEPLITDDDGHFQLDDVPFAGTVTAVYGADDYVGDTRLIDIPFAPGDGLTTQLVDASIALTAVDPDVVVNPEGTQSVSGTVYAGSEGPAVGATVHLYNASLSSDVMTTTTGPDGGFSFTGVVDDQYTFLIRVLAFDADGDGVSDYQYEELFIGGLDHVDDEGDPMNLSNLVVVLEPTHKTIAYVNFVPPLTDIDADSDLGDLVFGDPNGDIVMHFGAEADPATLVVSLVETVGDSIGDELAVTTDWNGAGTVLTISPTAPLQVDADPSTGWELRIEALLWSDGTTLVALDAGVGGAMVFAFDINSAPQLLPNPSPSIYLANLGDEDQSVTALSCDSRVCWLFDSWAYPLDGPADTASGGAAAGYVNEASGMQLVWTPIPGAESYNLYARQSLESGTDFVGWQPVEATVITGEFDAAASLSVYATGVLATGQFRWSEIGAGGEPGVGNPLAFNNSLEIAVTSVNATGVESPIDPTKTMLLTDVTSPALYDVDVVTPDDDPLGDEGFSGVEKWFDLRFTELMNPDVGGNWAVQSGTIVAMDAPGAGTWDGGDPLLGQTLSDTGRFGPATFDFRGACSMLTEPSAGSDNTVIVHDTEIFEGGGEVFFLQGGNPGQLAHPQSHTIVGVQPGVGQIALLDSLEASGGGALSAGDFACFAAASDGVSTPVQEALSGGTTIVTTDEPHLFYPNQPILIYSQTPSPVVHAANVRRIRQPVFAQIGPNLVPVDPGELEIDSPVPFDRETAVVMPRPSNQMNFRKLTVLDLATDAQTTGVAQLQFGASSMEASTIISGDALLIDVDGLLDTVDDRYFTAVAEVQMEQDDPSSGGLDETDFHAFIEAQPGELVALPPGLFLQAGTTLVIHLGDSFGLAGYSDTSGNSGLQSHMDQFSFCDGGFSGCQAGVFVY